MERFERIGLRIMNRAQRRQRDGRRPDRLDPRRPGQAQGRRADPRPGLHHRASACIRAQPRGRARGSPTRSSSARSSTATRSSSCCEAARARGARDRHPRRDHLAEAMSEPRRPSARPAATRPADPAGHAARSTTRTRCCPRASEPLLPPDAEVVESDASTRPPPATCCPSATGAARRARATAAARRAAVRPALPVPARRADRRRHRRRVVGHHRARIVGTAAASDERAARGRRGSRPSGGLAGRRSRSPSTSAAQYRCPAASSSCRSTGGDAGDRGHAAAVALRKTADERRRHPALRRQGRPLPPLRPRGRTARSTRASRRRERTCCCAARRSSSRSTRSATSTSTRSSCSCRRRKGEDPDAGAVLPPRRRSRAELDRPLTRVARCRTAPTAKTVTQSPDAALVDQLTTDAVPVHASRGSSSDDRGFLVLDPLQPVDAAAEALKAQQRRPRPRVAPRAPQPRAVEPAARASWPARRAWTPSTSTRARCGCAACAWSARRGCSACRGSGASTATRCGTSSSCARPLADAADDLVTHELCHVWQMQHHPLAHAAVLPVPRLRATTRTRSRRGAAVTRRSRGRGQRSSTGTPAGTRGYGRVLARLQAHARTSSRACCRSPAGGGSVSHRPNARRRHDRDVRAVLGRPRRSLRSSTSMDRRWRRSSGCSASCAPTGAASLVRGCSPRWRWSMTVAIPWLTGRAIDQIREGDKRGLTTARRSRSPPPACCAWR